MVEDLEDDSQDLAGTDTNAPNFGPPTMAKATPPPINPIVQQYLARKQQLASAQDKANTNQLYASLARAGGTLAAGIAQSSKPVNQDAFNALDAAASAPVQAVKNQQASDVADLKEQDDLMDLQKKQESEDPNSPQSIAKKNLIKSVYPNKFSDEDLEKLSAADIGDAVMKPLELDEKVQAAKQAKVEKSQDRADERADKAEKRSQEAQDKALTQTQQMLESARGNPAAAQAERDLYNAQKAQSLIHLYPDPNNLSQPQINLLASEIGKIASGTVPAQHELQGITPDTLVGRMSSFVTKLTNDPTPAHAAEFIKQYKDYLDSMTKDAQGVIQDKYGRIIETRKSQLGDDNYKNLQENYINRFMKSTGSPSGGGGLDASIGVKPGDIAAEVARRKAAKSLNAQQPAPTPPGVTPGFAYGGKIPGHAEFPGDDPRNDVVPINASKGEAVLPVHVMQSKDPAMAAYLYVKNLMENK